MNNLKDELDGIEIPTELRARARFGIEQALKEQKLEPARTVRPSKRHKFLTGALTATITVAAVLFLLAVVNPNTVTFNTADGAVTASIWYSKWLVIPILSVLLLLLLYGAFKLIRKFPQWKSVAMFASLFGVCCASVGIWYSANMLQERVVFPIAYEFVKGQEGYMVPVSYVVDRFDASTDMAALVIDGIKIEPDEAVDDYLTVGESIQIQRQTINYAYKMAYFTVTAAQLQQMIEEEANLSNSEVLFLDGMTVPIQIEHFNYAKDAEGAYIVEDDVQSWTMSSTENGEIFEFHLDGETVIEAVEFPKHAGVNDSYELRLDGQVIKRVNMDGLADVDLLPIAATDATQLRIKVNSSDWNQQLQRFHFPLFIHGEQMIYKAEIYNWGLHQFDHRSLKAILNTR